MIDLQIVHNPAIKADSDIQSDVSYNRWGINAGDIRE